MTTAALGELLNLLVALAFLFLLVGVGYRRSITKKFDSNRQADDGPEGEPYRIYTKEFDRQLAAHEIGTELWKGNPDLSKGWFQTGKDAWKAAANSANRIVEEQRQELATAFSSLSANYFRHAAITLLVDHSGSMRGAPIEWAAATTRLIAESLIAIGATVEILGYSSSGWHGGHPYRQWKAEKRPKRPGRLCALLHIVYRSFDDDGFDAEAWRAMLNPNLLRENVDGESLEWAANRLGVRTDHRLLIILSDGAPVDDATLMHNGPSYLYRHLMQVIAKIESDQRVSLGAIGIGYKVSEYYPVSVSITEVSEMPRAVSELLVRMSSMSALPIIEIDQPDKG